MEISTNELTISTSKSTLFDFLSKVENFEAIMPENISVFKVIDDDAFKFALKGMPEIVLKFTERQAVDKIVLGSTNDQFPFELEGVIGGTDEKATLRLRFSGSFNPMISMMIKTPLTNFIETLAQKTVQHFAA